MKCECNYHLGMGPNLKCPIHGKATEPSGCSNELLACKNCGVTPEIENKVNITHKFKFATSRILHFCGIVTIDLASDGGFRKKDANISDVADSISEHWNKLNAR